MIAIPNGAGVRAREDCLDTALETLDQSSTDLVALDRERVVCVTAPT